MFPFENDRPIYLQIFEIIMNDIISGKYSAGEKLPSVRELSVMLKVNPNTLQKALADLEEQGIIFTERTNGKFVTEDKKIIENKRRELIENRVDEFLSNMAKMRITKSEIIKIIKNTKKGEN